MAKRNRIDKKCAYKHNTFRGSLMNCKKKVMFKIDNCIYYTYMNIVYISQVLRSSWVFGRHDFKESV